MDIDTCIFQLIDCETGNRSAPMKCDVPNFVEALLEVPEDRRELNLVLILMDNVKGKPDWSQCPLFTVKNFIHVFGASLNGREEVSPTV